MCYHPIPGKLMDIQAMCERNNFNLKNLSTKDFWELGDEIIFKKIDGVVFKEAGYMAPMNAPDTFLINIAKFKSHQMGITASIKNLQGITGRKFHQFCGGHFDIFKSYDKRYHQFFQPDYMAQDCRASQEACGCRYSTMGYCNGQTSLWRWTCLWSNG